MSRTRSALLTVGAVLGVACLLSLLAMVSLGVRPLVVQSGSMSPGIPTGSVALGRERPADEVRVGDVVSVPGPSGARVMHRVVEVAALDDHTVLTLQGDANDAPDRAPYVVDRVHQVFFDVPQVGYAVDWLSGPVGRFAGGALVGVLLLVAFSRGEPAAPPPRHLARPAAPPRRRGRRAGAMAASAVPSRPPHGRRVGAMAASAVLAVAAVGGADVVTARPASAAFVDSATMTSGLLTAHTVPAPVIGSCNVTGNALTGFTARITWPGVTSPHALGYTAQIVESGTSLTVVTDGANRRVDVTTGLLGSLLGTDVTVRIRGFVTTSPTWTSAPTDKKLRVGLLGLSLTCL